MKSDRVFKRAHNLMLVVLSGMQPGDPLPSELELCEKLSVSRTTVRKVIDALSAQEAVEGTGRLRRVGRTAGKVSRYPDADTVPVSEQVEARFLKWMLQGDTRPGTSINELELARRFGVATTSVREFLNRFQRFGLIEKRRNRSWVFKGFTQDFAIELFEIREMFELRSALAFGCLPDDAPAWKGLKALEAGHLDILNDIDRRFHDFSELDSRFHRFIHASVYNRFIEGFSDINALIFHYHYQWNKADERQRNEVAIREHLTYIDALATKNPKIIELACKAHLDSARETLLRSTQG